MPGARSPDPEYVAARRVLLDALEALGTHRKAVVLVGAQAIYLHVGAGDLAVAPYTTDGDLAIDPRELGEQPAIAATLEAAGFVVPVVEARGLVLMAPKSRGRQQGSRPPSSITPSIVSSRSTPRTHGRWTSRWQASPRSSWPSSTRSQSARTAPSADRTRTDSTCCAFFGSQRRTLWRQD